MQQQQNMQNQQQPNLQYPPNDIMSGKDALYLTDMLSWNLLAAKKAHFFAQQCQMQQIKDEAEKVAQMHQRHYEKILGHLNDHQNQNPQQYMKQ